MTESETERVMSYCLRARGAVHGQLGSTVSTVVRTRTHQHHTTAPLCSMLLHEIS